MINESLIQTDKLTREKIRDISQSFIVQAPAGSGKTECLTQRYLALLAGGVTEPEEIIAITFTRKATYEMQARIIGSLQAALLPMPSEPHRQVTWQLAKKVLAQDETYQWNLLSNPHRMRITTIDSLCASLVKQMPMTTEFGGLPDVVENAEHLYKEAADNILQQLINKGILYDELYALADYVDNDFSVLQQLIITMLKSRSHWQSYLVHEDATKQSLANNRRKMIEYFIECADEILMPNLSMLLNLLATIDTDNATDKAFWLPLLQSDESPTLEKYQLLATLLLTQKGEWRKKIDKSMGIPSNKLNKPIIADLKTWIADCQSPELHYYLQLITSCPALDYTDKEWQLVEKLLTLLPIASIELRNVFKLHQQVDFTEIALSVFSALVDLEGPTDLALRLDYQIKHLLIDEFQDTSVLQYELLCQLTLGWEANDGRSLFLVGDPMQSIYRFREAEVSLFKYVQQYGLPNVTLTPVNLYLNFRSKPEVVTWVNQLCGQLFPDIDRPEYGEISFSASATLGNEQKNTIVEHHLHAEHSDVAQSVVSICQKTLSDDPKNQIAILIRSRNHVNDIEALLRQHKLSFCLHDIVRCEDNPTIQDLIALTCALLDPSDRIAWLACLRAPYLGLTLKEITDLIGSQTSLIQEQCHQSTHPQLQRFFAALNNYQVIIQQSPITHWLEVIWEAIGGYQYDQTQHHYNTCRAYFTYLRSIQGPVTRDKLIQNLSSIKLQSSNEDASIHILTIHKSKGLEFDTVIIPHCEKETSTQMDKKLLNISEWYHPEMQKHLLLMAPCSPVNSETNTLYDFISQEEQQKYRAELQRLFYVAITRAKTNLHFVSHINVTSDRKFTPPKHSFLNYLLPDCEDKINHCIESVSNDTLEPEPVAIINHLQRYSFGVYEQKKLPKHFNVITDNRLNATAQSTEQHIGTIIHQYLQQFSLIDNLSLALLDPIKTNLPRICLHAGICSRQVETASETIITALHNCLSDETALWILSQREQAYSEYSLCYGDKIIRLDRTFCVNNKQWIVDYKITTTTPNNHDSIQNTYGEQLNQYAVALKVHTKKPIQCAIYLPLQQEFYHWPALDLLP